MGSAFEKEIQAEDIKLFIPVYPNNTNNNINTNISNSNSIGGGNSESDSRDLVILFGNNESTNTNTVTSTTSTNNATNTTANNGSSAISMKSVSSEKITNNNNNNTEGNLTTTTCTSTTSLLQRAFVHGSSLNADNTTFYSCNYLVYADKYIPPSSSSTSNNNNSNSDGEKVFLQYTSEIIPWALLLFAGKMNYQYKEQSLVIDDYIHFQCSEETFIVLSTLQSVLDSLLFLPADSGKETQSTIAKDDNDRDDDGNGDKVWMMMMEKREELLDCVRALLLVDCTSSSQQP
eukprot:scaffold386_cov174-Ochromonas_danica.AAC.13